MSRSSHSTAASASPYQISKACERPHTKLGCPHSQFVTTYEQVSCISFSANTISLHFPSSPFLSASSTSNLRHDCRSNLFHTFRSNTRLFYLLRSLHRSWIMSLRTLGRHRITMHSTHHPIAPVLRIFRSIFHDHPLLNFDDRQSDCAGQAQD
jgi:hypothetical protein